MSWNRSDALPLARQVGHHLAMHALGVARAEVLAVDVDGEDGDVALLEMRHRALAVGEIGKAEERRHRLAERLLHGAEAELDLLARAWRGSPSAGWRATRCGCQRCGRSGRTRAPSRGPPLPCGRPRRRWPWCNAPAGPRARIWCRRAAARRRRSAPPRRRRECPAPCIGSRSAGPSWCRSRPRATRRAHPGRECRPPARRPVPAHIRACPRPERRPPEGPKWSAFSPPTRPAPAPS